MTTGDLTIVFDEKGGTDAQLVRERLDMYNVGATGVSTYYSVHFFVKSRRGETRGGVLGGIWGGWLHVSFLWIDESVRGQDWGTRLMDHAEAYARQHGCHSVTLDTHSIPGPPVLRGPRLRGVRRARRLPEGPQEVLPEEEAIALNVAAFGYP